MDDISSVQNVKKVTSYASLESQVRAKARQGRAHCLSCSKNLHVVYIVAILMKLLNDNTYQEQYISGSHNKSTRDVKATTINIRTTTCRDSHLGCLAARPRGAPAEIQFH